MSDGKLLFELALGAVLVVSVGFWAFLARAIRRAHSDLDSWAEALAKRSSARNDLRMAQRALKTARRSYGHLDELAPPLRDAIGASAIATKRAEIAAHRLREAGAQVAKTVRVSVERDRTALDRFIAHRVDAAWNTLARIRDDARSAWAAVQFLRKHWPIVSVFPLLTVVAGDLVYYELFDFNVLPYYWDYPVGTLFITVALGLPVLLTLLALFVSMYLAAVLLLAVLLLVALVMSVLRRMSYEVARVYCAPCESTAYARMTLGLLPAGRWTPRPTLRTMVPYWQLFGRSARRLGQLATGGRRVLWVQAGVATVGVAVFVVLFDPAYRAYATCQGGGGTRVVLDPPMAEQDDFVRIGSLGQHVFLVTGGSCETATEGGAGGNEPRRLAVWLRNALYPVRGVIDWLRLPADAETSRWNVCNIPVVGRACAALSERTEYLLADQTPRSYEGEVVVVPPNRVLCMYEGPADEERVCMPPDVEGTEGEDVAREDGESLLLAQLQREVPCGAAAIVSEAIVFDRGDATEPIAGGVTEIRCFLGGLTPSRSCLLSGSPARTVRRGTTRSWLGDELGESAVLCRYRIQGTLRQDRSARTI